MRDEEAWVEGLANSLSRWIARQDHGWLGSVREESDLLEGLTDDLVNAVGWLGSPNGQLIENAVMRALPPHLRFQADLFVNVLIAIGTRERNVRRRALISVAVLGAVFLGLASFGSRLRIQGFAGPA